MSMDDKRVIHHGVDLGENQLIISEPYIPRYVEEVLGLIGLRE
jgi:hypothetical protein